MVAVTIWYNFVAKNTYRNLKLVTYMMFSFNHYSVFLCVLTLILCTPVAEHSHVPTYPCPSIEAINWVRDPQNCNKYYICYFGQPITMPSCPPTQIWSNGALNCVPESSPWNDCKSPLLKQEKDKHTILSTAQTIQPRTIFSKITSNWQKSTVTPDTTTPSTTPSTKTAATTTESELTAEKLPSDTPCLGRSGIIPHPKQCHWYYNCSLSSHLDIWKRYEMYTVECRYPQLFDPKQMRCREYLNNDCGSRFEPVDHCEYRENKCATVHCIPCRERYAKCRGKTDGIYPFRTEVWSPIFVTCYGQRNIAQDECLEPTPIFSPIDNDCVSLFLVPKENNGLKPDCSFRENGYYPDEQGRCSIYYKCRNQRFMQYHECGAGQVFNPISHSCQLPHMAPPPCGESTPPSCQGRQNGFYADLYGRCPYYFECRQFQFRQYRRCNFGSFDPFKQECVIPNELMVKPCGLRANPCEKRQSGQYVADSSNSCHNYIECNRGFLVYNGTCPVGQVFHQEEGKCEEPQNGFSSCGPVGSCANKKDGRYPAPERGCSYHYECKQGRFLGYKQCNYLNGGIYFNGETSKCDSPQNVCPPCGYKWFGCPRAHLF